MPDICLIGNAHLDPVWLWRWQEGFSEILSTFRSALDRMKEFPDFRFTAAGALYYEWIEKTDPAMFAEIRERVKEQRWNIAGGWFLQPDCNTPCGESFARHALISQRYFLEKFGVAAKTGYNVDSFGHNASLPQLLCKSGMDAYVFMRPSEGENPTLHDVFLWEGADGSQVAVYRIPHRYNIDEAQLAVLDHIHERAESDGVPRMAFCGVGNHGGGPTVRLLRALEARGDKREFFSTPDDYFTRLNRAALPVVNGELQHHARGCYSACSFIKKANRRGENRLLDAEAMCTLASRLAGMKYPAKKLRHAWKALMFNQFHDILGGCAIKSAYEDASYLHGEIMSITEQAIHRAAALLSRRIDTLDGRKLPAGKSEANWRLWEADIPGTPLILFNPHPWEVTATAISTQPVSAVRSPDGSAIPVQRIRSEHTNGRNDKYYTAFRATVPPLGYAVYRLCPGGEAAAAEPLIASEQRLENEFLSAEFDPETGELSRLTDKRTGTVLLDAPCAAVLLDETACDTWAHDKASLGPDAAVFGSPAFSLIEQGGVRAVLRVTSRSGESLLRRDYILEAGSDALTVRMTVDFHEKHRAFKLSFPVPGSVRAAIPFGSILREPGGGEEPCGAWLTAGKLGFASDFACGYDTADGAFRPSVLRGAIYADHFGVRDEFCEYMDQGVGEFTYQLFPYAGEADAARRARTLELPLIPYCDSFHGGELPQTYSAFTGDTASAVVTALKEAEDGNGTVIRFAEAEGQDVNVRVRLFDEPLHFSLRPHEIKTIRPGIGEADLLERV